MIDRRTVLAQGGAFLALSAMPGGNALAATPAGKLRVGSVKFGSLAWLLETIKAEGIAEKANLEIEVFELATNHAGPVALLAGEVEVMVSDWTWAMRQRSGGEAVKFSPFSSALGALMVPKDSPVQSVADLAGKKLGVAGTAIDKSWLLLRAYSRSTTGRDIAETASPVFGAAPLMTEEIKNGRLDAVLNFWTFAARLSGAGYRQVIGVAEILKALQVEPLPSLVGFIWKESTGAAKAGEIATFLKCVQQGNEVLAKSDAAWERLKPLLKAADEAEFAALKAYYRAGIPAPWTDAQTKAAEKLTNLLVELGDKELMGAATRFDAKLFHVGT
jgi:NitT/TauT family transport system substrate-binding protein